MATLQDYRDCDTAKLRLLDIQIISQINRMSPGCLVPFSSYERLVLGGGVHPWLQAPAAKALKQVIAARPNKILKINSALRTPDQQLVLWRHYTLGRCGIPAAAKPGQSNHNSGLALDIEDQRGWRPYFERFEWDWIGSFDPPHFDYEGKGCVDLGWLSIKAFQVLYNYNYPNTTITADGRWGNSTEAALLLTPVTGFARTPASQADITLLTEVYHSPSRSLRSGMSGDEVRRLQKALGIRVDGIFGDNTTQAVKAFQLQKGLTGDGVVGLSTKTALRLPA